MIQNLVDNPVKYSSAGDRVRVRASTDDGHVLIDGVDEGPAIAPEDHELIFEKFGRSSGGSAKPGTGLGLFIAPSIAEAHGGSLGVQSVPQRGSIFRLELPVD